MRTETVYNDTILENSSLLFNYIGKNDETNCCNSEIKYNDINAIQNKIENDLDSETSDNGREDTGKKIKRPQLSIDETTDLETISKYNSCHLDFFNTHTNSIISQILRTDFQDGMTNEVTEQVKTFFEINRMVACNWLNSIFSTNQNNPVIISGLLRIISMLDSNDYPSFLMPIVRAGLGDKNSMTQEAALMVIEEWRTKECLDALLNTAFVNGWIKDYSNKIILELKKELVNNVN